MRTKIKYVFVIFISFLVLISCDKWITPDLNIDPTAPSDATLAVILPTTQAGLAYTLGGEIGRFTSLLTQHHTGISRQHQGLYNYNLTESDLDNAWLNMYVGPMENSTIIMKKAIEQNSPHYQGIAEVIMAISLGMWTDILGDVPYHEAFLGNANLQPKYDKQEDIYNTIYALLDSAVKHLNASASTFQPGADDLIYGGDMSKWTKAAYTVKARYLLHLQKYSEALAALKNGFASNDDDLQFKFGTVETQANPLYQFMQQRGDISMGPELIKLMNQFNDPRRPAFADKGTAADYTVDANPGPIYNAIDAIIPMCSYPELKFIEAECEYRAGSKANAYAAYLAGIAASCQKTGADSASTATYIAQTSVGVGEGNLSIQNIIEQKYIALYFFPETYTDWRRTNFPILTPVTGTQIPRRFIYPQSERIFNGTNLKNLPDGDYNPTNSFIFTKMWWDKKW